VLPWSLEREQGIESATVDSNIETPQYLQPVVNTGVIDLNGNWIGVRTTDKLFSIDPPHLAIPNGAAVLSPQKADHEYIDMTGYTNIFIALKVSNGGNFAIGAIMGPDTYAYANLTPVNAASILRGSIPTQSASGGGITNELFNDPAESLTADVWNILYIQEVLENQKLLQFKITNNSGGESNIEFAYQRIV
jgi:hypothetical protein